MLAMILRDIERFEESECQFLFSPEFLARLNRLDDSAMRVLRCANDRVWGPILLEAFIKDISSDLKSLESEAVPEDHVPRICHQRKILPFQLARHHANIELWNMRREVEAEQLAPAEKRSLIKMLLRR
jgi:hypothetical protein